MLTIRKAQMDAFRARSAAGFKHRLETYLRLSLPAFDDDVLPARVERAAAEASGYGISREADVARYAEISLRYWGGAAPPKPAERILGARRVDAAERLARVREWLSADGADG